MTEMGGVGKAFIREFSAFADCPGCGEFDHHGLYSPWTPPTEPKELVATVTDWAGNVLRKQYSAPGGNFEAYDFNTDTCAVIRECDSCGARWGEK